MALRLTGSSKAPAARKIWDERKLEALGGDLVRCIKADPPSQRKVLQAGSLLRKPWKPWSYRRRRSRRVCCVKLVVSSTLPGKCEPACSDRTAGFKMLAMRVSVGVLVSARIATFTFDNACLYLFHVCRLLQMKLGPPSRETCGAYLQSPWLR